MIKFDIKKRFTGRVQFTAEIDCNESASRSLKIGLSVRWGLGNDADLTDADLTGADLRGADLTGADLTGADLTDADLTGAKFGDAPVIENIHAKVYEAASREGALDMDDWHGEGGFCGTTHCRAGWVNHLAGPEGRALEEELGPATAALAIYAASDPGYFERDGVPDFYCGNGAALADMKRLADRVAS